MRDKCIVYEKQIPKWREKRGITCSRKCSRVYLRIVRYVYVNWRKRK